DNNDQILTTDDNGDVNWQNVEDVVSDNQKINYVKEGDAVSIDSTITENTTVYTINADTVGANNGLSKTDGNIQLGGDLTEATAITTDAANTLAIDGLQEGEKEDEVMVVDPSTGVLKKTNAVMPKFFYMPSIVMPTAAAQLGSIPYGGTEITEGGGTFTVNLHAIYNAQFGLSGGNSVSSAGSGHSLPILGATDLIYN